MSKQEQIVRMFDSIAKKYDFVNRVLTFGIDKKWREKAVKKTLELIDKKDVKILDVACGTGDMIEIWKKEANKKDINIKICGLDPSVGMLEVAKKRFPEVKFYKAYATDIPCESKTIDGISISFGIRNVLEIKKAICEFKRVLKKDGIVLVLEFTKAEKPNKFRECVDFYSNKILPKIGGILSKNKEAYEYLPNSIENFYTPNELAALFIECGFNIEKLETFNFGQVTMLIARS
ncbi:bifunctional demethylmenaquinone methyltransferase/2-methoxy-6-polyprenyl-1,4-benzoquinol methylase UbiE [Caminibacter pacificus]|uniref:Demethylmenaquinone methyltransferase n=1 Tax=Caminibacter pacificus TaxID=1424653 RepID=A0AAJ4RDL8_9BACT|nr:bifunctional demethylmenaquinone methyltransferase/2-methoxy-6-polyprenyl-1,4-benzoquinol methylase UbiE [Caminibacter pacificus]QCI28622.1 bifunctional demethylmenaquinone methyltransferase/2-methoxy-6-polyprenyl-1,4-benzoquinol methylase UbiE [Caminibacter pacificus]ROR40649.1 demethylmenaquinone methyltransferase [Caminibacter pacificus]